MTPIHIPSEIIERTQNFVGRTWVVRQLLDWLDRGTERYFILTGEPGSGKTALAAWLIGAGPTPAAAADRAKLERIRAVWSAGHFCVGRTQGDTINPSYFAQTIAQQFADRYPGYATATVKAIDPEFNIKQTVQQNWGEIIGVKTERLIINGRHPQDIYDLAVRNPLRNFLNVQPALRICILVDGLDEALSFDDQQNIVTLLSGSTNLPRNVRFLLTCRSNERRVLDQFADVRLLDLAEPENAADIQTYVLARLHELGASDQTEQATATETVASQLVAVADHNFLYTRFLLDEVQAGQRTLDNLAGLPRGLYPLYRSYLDRVVPDTGSQRFAETWLQGYEPLLGSLSVAVPVAPEPLLPRWLGRDKGEVQAHLDTVTQIIERTEENGGAYTLYHRSMADFLAADFYEDNKVRRRNQYYAEPKRQHDRIVRYYLQALQEKWQGDWRKCDAYGLRQLANHLRMRLLLADEDDQASLAAELYHVVLDDGFRGAQQQRFAGIAAALPDLRSALTIALARDELVTCLRCLAAYRQTVYSQSVTEAIFRAVDQGDFAEALKAADYYGPAPKPRGRWARVLHFYLAWEAAEQGNLAAAGQAAAAAETMSLQEQTYGSHLYEELSDVLLLRAARRLVNQEQNLETCLRKLVPTRNLDDLRYAQAEPTIGSDEEQQALEDRLNERLTQLERLAAEGSAEFVSGTLFLDPETLSAETADLRFLLSSLARHHAGQAGIKRALAANLRNPYPRYRDIALVPIAIATVAVPDTDWVRRELRTILRTGLDDEGITFTFDLPAILLAEAQRRNLPAPELSTYLEQALQQDDRWGTPIRVRSAQAAAFFWQGQTDAALATLERAAQTPHVYAGYATMAMLLLVNRCYEFGVPQGHNLPTTLHAKAATFAEGVYDWNFREERRQLVQAYHGWQQQMPPDISTLRTFLAEIQDPDARRVYKDLASARWSATTLPNLSALKELIGMMLIDSTTLDATLGRLFGLRIREHRLGQRPFSDAELSAAVAICAQSFTTGRPWAFGQWH